MGKGYTWERQCNGVEKLEVYESMIWWRSWRRQKVWGLLREDSGVLCVESVVSGPGWVARQTLCIWLAWVQVSPPSSRWGQVPDFLGSVQVPVGVSLGHLYPSTLLQGALQTMEHRVSRATVWLWLRLWPHPSPSRSVENVPGVSCPTSLGYFPHGETGMTVHLLPAGCWPADGLAHPDPWTGRLPC